MASPAVPGLTQKRRGDIVTLNFEVIDRENRLRCWTEADLARAAGIHYTTLRAIRKADGRTRLGTADRILRAYEGNPPRELAGEMLRP